MNVNPVLVIFIFLGVLALAEIICRFGERGRR